MRRIFIALLIGLVMPLTVGFAGEHCTEHPSDQAVLSAVMSEVDAICEPTGVVLRNRTSRYPKFPTTIEQDERMKLLSAQMADETLEREARNEAAGEYIDMMLGDPPSGDLDFGSERTVAASVVEEAFSRIDCPLPLPGIEPVPTELDELDPLEFWNAVREQFGRDVEIMSISLPAYSKDGTEALVSFACLTGPCGAAGGWLVYLERTSDEWAVLWKERTLIVATPPEEENAIQ